MFFFRICTYIYIYIYIYLNKLSGKEIKKINLLKVYDEMFQKNKNLLKVYDEMFEKHSFKDIVRHAHIYIMC